ncbi:MAG: hypothetical protein J7M34_11770, partial [Anaerolineae bacterium]|nr:hypothetical protein [Anaerolineae bacterium]
MLARAWRLTYHPVVQTVGRVLLGVAVFALGVGLGLVLVSPKWHLAVTMVGLSAIFLLILMDQRDGFLVWM